MTCAEGADRALAIQEDLEDHRGQVKLPKHSNRRRGGAVNSRTPALNGIASHTVKQNYSYAGSIGIEELSPIVSPQQRRCGRDPLI